jgi:hypothetical protein
MPRRVFDYGQHTRRRLYVIAQIARRRTCRLDRRTDLAALRSRRMHESVAKRVLREPELRLQARSRGCTNCGSRIRRLGATTRAGTTEHARLISQRIAALFR